MENFAVELLTTIFTLACTDGGSTACSLALVCRDFRAVSRPLRLYSVALTGAPDKLKLFVVQLKREHAAPGANAIPKVRHLFLRTQDIKQVAADISGVISEDEGDTNEGPNHEDEDASTLPRTRTEYAALVSALLRAVAPTLETLVFLPHAYAPAVEQGIVFPLLRELTLATPPVARDERPGPPASSMPLYPSLRRLHMLSGSLEVDHWACHAPGLTHIRIAGVGYGARAHELRRIHGDEAAGPSARPFGQLQTVLFQLAPPPPARYCHGMPIMRYERMILALWTSQAGASVPVYIFSSEQEVPAAGRSGAGERYSKHREEWEESMRGGIGCWRVSDEYARGAYKDGAAPLYMTPWLDPVSARKARHGAGG